MSTEPQMKRQHAIDALEQAERLLLQSGGEREQILCRVAIKAVYGDFYETGLTRIAQITTGGDEVRELLLTARLCLESLINMREVV